MSKRDIENCGARWVIRNGWLELTSRDTFILAVIHKDFLLELISNSTYHDFGGKYKCKSEKQAKILATMIYH
jgi:hypothetical protein